VDEVRETVATVGERPTIAELFERLAHDLQALFRAEFALYRAEAARRALSAGWAVGLIIAAVTLAQGALIALLVGLILLLAPVVGTGWAIVAVTTGALGLAGVLTWFGWRNANRMIDPDQP
jgi:hypothetical protein